MEFAGSVRLEPAAIVQIGEDLYLMVEEKSGTENENFKQHASSPEEILTDYSSAQGIQGSLAFSASLNPHECGKKHKNSKVYYCDSCKVTYIRRSDMIDHIRVHTGEKPYSCDQCEKSFTRNADLNRHLQIHAGIKPYSCELCEKTFSRHHHLKAHLSTHTGEKPYSCEHCQKAFGNRGSLHQHAMIHSGARPHSCQYCDKSFRQKSHLKTHLKIFAGQKEHPPALSAVIKKNNLNAKSRIEEEHDYCQRIWTEKLH